MRERRRGGRAVASPAIASGEPGADCRD